MSPFAFARIVGQRNLKNMIDGYLDRRQKTDNLDQKTAIADYIYHLFMKKSTSDYSLMILFNQGMQAQLPLGTPDKLANPNFPIPVSFIMGSEDWVRYLDEDYGQVCVDARQANKDSKLAVNQRGEYIFCP